MRPFRPLLPALLPAAVALFPLTAAAQDPPPPIKRQEFPLDRPPSAEGVPAAVPAPSAAGDPPPAEPALPSAVGMPSADAEGAPTPDAAAANALSAAMSGGGPDRAGGPSPRPGPSASVAMDWSLNCPRPHLRELLLAEAGAGGAMAALGIEREVLVLCAERQRLVEGLLTGERRLAELLPRSRLSIRSPVPLPPEPEPEPPVAEVPEPQPEPPAPDPEPAVADAAEPPPEPEPAVAEAADPAPPPLRDLLPPAEHGWFWLIGSGADLRAGLTDGAEVWFVRAGDEVPGLGTVSRIRGAPRPGVWLVGSADPLPHRPHPASGGR